MNTIQNYGITNYQTNFQARGGKKTVKTLADVVKKQKSLSKKEQTENQILNLIKRMNLECNCNGGTFMNDSIDRHDMLHELLNTKI